MNHFDKAISHLTDWAEMFEMAAEDPEGSVAITAKAEDRDDRLLYIQGLLAEGQHSLRLAIAALTIQRARE